MNTKEKDEYVGMNAGDQAAMRAAADIIARGQQIGDQSLVDEGNRVTNKIKESYNLNEADNGQSAPAAGPKKTVNQSSPSYINQYQNTIDRMRNGILNRKAFTYDHNNDPMYQQYADSYTRMGQQAMEDTLAQVSARTGGLASSYAGTAAQQTYNGYMSALADKVPELRQLAYQMYMDEGDTMRQNLQMLQGLEATEYGRYRDRVSDDKWQQEFDTQNSQWQQEFDTQNSQWQQEFDTQNSQWQKEFDFEKGLTAASLLAQAGNYSGYKDLFGLSEDDMAALQAGHISEKDLQAAELLAQAGDFSGYQKIFNLSPEKVAKLEKVYQQQNTPKVTGNKESVASLWGGFKESPVSDVIMNKIETITNQDDLTLYLGSLAESGIITEAQMMALFNVYKPEAISPSITEEWAMVDNGGLNWGWGIDNNAKVQDRNGITYTLKELVDKLVDDGMTKAEAEDYVKQIQKELGI